MTQQSPGSEGSWRHWYSAGDQADAQQVNQGRHEDMPSAEDYGVPGSGMDPTGSPRQQSSGYQHSGDHYAQPVGWNHSASAMPQAHRHATTALICGIIGFFVLGIVLGPVAIYQAKKAQSFGVNATPGLVLGWIVTLLHAVGIVFIILSIWVFMWGGVGIAAD